MNKSPRTFVYLVALTFALFAVAAAAQQAAGKGGNGQPAGGQQGAKQLQLFNELNLDEAQAVEVQAIMEASRLMHAEEWANFQATIDALRAETHDAILSVLDEAQQQRFLELQTLRAEQWAEGGRGRGGMRNGSGNGNGAGGGNGNGTGECQNPDGPNADCPNTGNPDGDG